MPISRTFKIGGDLQVARLGFGTMRLTGEGAWGEPSDRAECLAVLSRLPQLGVHLVDTADAYGPDVCEPMIREALHPYGRTVVATKGGFVRTGPNRWTPMGRPEYLRQQVEMSRRPLGVDRIDLWQLHRIDPKVPRDEQLDAMRQFREEGLVRHLGLSGVSVEDVEAASRYFPVATVQNRFSPADRGSEEVLRHCETLGIGFIPWFPLGAGRLVDGAEPLVALAPARGATPSQVALAWLLRRSPVILPIPGTSKVRHLEENVGAYAVELGADDFDLLDRASREAPATMSDGS